MLCYFFLIVSAFVFSLWTYTRCGLLGGFRVEEPWPMDVFFGVAVALAVYAFRNLP
jgi:hypothetical protein